MVIADGVPVKSCMTEAKPGMVVEPLNSLPRLPEVENVPTTHEPTVVKIPVLILGGGPAGLSAAIELGKRGIKALIVDDKHRLGGKLVLQTHKFFGSHSAVYAGTRGIDIATKLQEQVEGYDSLDVWLNSTAVAVFSDRKVGILKDGVSYVLVDPEVLLVTTGARERSLVFRGNTLPGVYGAGAFQTLVNRDLVKAADRLFIVGGGNVGLIAGYHALQAGIEVVGLVEAMPECGGYLVHKDKLVRMGVPIYTSHTVISANGTNQVESVTVAQINDKFQPIKGTEKSFNCDTLLIAVGLEPVNEFYEKAVEFGFNVFSAGDAEEIAEASAAIFTGKIRGVEIARSLGAEKEPVPSDWARTAEILKSKPGKVEEEKIPEDETGVFPVFHCRQEIPCNPCAAVCPLGLIRIDPDDIRKKPEFIAAQVGKKCVGCANCVAICPGLAITQVDYRKDAEHPIVTLAHEFPVETVPKGEYVSVVDTQGEELGKAEVVRTWINKLNPGTILVQLRVAREYAKRVAGIRVQPFETGAPLPEAIERLEDDTIVCRCERVTAGEIRALIREGYHDMNAIKAITRAGMGACGGKTCTNLIKRIFREEGVPLAEVVEGSKRPLFVEIPFGTLAGVEENHG
jgi:NADPH-dependent 2,4-dienoyl-CoA reductase/sulfur reductase-like enzyme/Fe-S-cluster-containing hydrogenase component 2/bacterioferritin-associated ferredoxin